MHASRCTLGEKHMKWRTVGQVGLFVCCTIALVVFLQFRHQSAPEFGELEILVEDVATISEDATDRTKYVFSQDDPRQDGWLTEVLHEEAKQVLKSFASYWTQTDEQLVSKIKQVLTDDFSSSPLQPAALETVFDDPLIRIEHALFPAPSEGNPLPPNRLDRREFVADFQALWENSPEVSDLHIGFKIFAIEAPDSATFFTRQYVSIDGKIADHRFEIHTTWKIDWTKTHENKPPKIKRVDAVEQFEKSVAQIQGKSLFRDDSENLFANDSCYYTQLALGRNYWRKQLDVRLEPDISGHHGIAVGDVNGDRLDDVYVCQPGGLPNRLFLRQSDGSLTDISAQAGVDWIDSTAAALFVDLDNDQDQDLVLSTLSKPATLLMENDGTGIFTLRSEPIIAKVYSLSAADFDNDSDVDLYLCNYSSDLGASVSLAGADVFGDANNGGRNVLLCNQGNWNFVDVTNDVGLDVDNRRNSLAASWDDFDNDGDVDLYVANDFGPNNLYRNDQGTFVDVAKMVGAEDRNFGMSVTWGDCDRDGRMDLYVSNMFSAAGNRIVQQAKFRPDLTDNLRARFLQFARGNTLLTNSADGIFHDISASAGVQLGRWAWSSNFIDINNDGWEDLLVASGNVTGESAGDL